MKIRLNSFALAGVLLAGTIGAASGAPADATTTASMNVPSFDNAQVAHGKSLYSSACAKCHGASLQGMAGPALSGPAFAPAGHSHLTIGGIYKYMSSNMPADRPGQMKDQEYADIMAFLLYSNGYRPKATKLTADMARTSSTPLVAGPGQ
jgi:cytochrome c